jgi:ATP synthase protein I
MAATGSRLARRLLLVIAGWQCALGFAVALVLWLAWSGQAAWSALIGGAIAALGSASMGAAVGMVRPEATPARLLYGFVFGEVLKFVVTVALFVAVILALRVTPLAMLGTFVAAFVVYWIVLIKASSKLAP